MKRISLISIVLAAAVLVSGGIIIYRDAAARKPALVKVYGDDAALRGISFGGIIADRYSKQDFTVSDGAVRSEFKKSNEYLLSSYTSYEPRYPVERCIFIPPDAQTAETKNSGGLFTMTQRAGVYFNLAKEKEGIFSVMTGVEYYSESMEIGMYGKPDKDGFSSQGFTFENIDTGLTHNNMQSRDVLREGADKRIYLFTPTGADCRGVGGAYDVTDYVTFSPSEPLFPSFGKQKPAGAVNIAPILLGDGDVRILDMQTYADRLIFLVYENGFSLRVFDLTQNKFLEPLALDIPWQYTDLRGKIYTAATDGGLLMTLVRSDDIGDDCAFIGYDYAAHKISADNSSGFSDSQIRQKIYTAPDDQLIGVYYTRRVVMTQKNGIFYALIEFEPATVKAFGKMPEERGEFGIKEYSGKVALIAVRSDTVEFAGYLDSACRDDEYPLRESEVSGGNYYDYYDLWIGSN